MYIHTASLVFWLASASLDWNWTGPTSPCLHLISSLTLYHIYHIDATPCPHVHAAGTHIYMFDTHTHHTHTHTSC
ncbi:hypothetical protein C8R45DRAFT_188439 [Mycena sanguinolenta]|nr:hypothetical protein C8R45DRAFT_188439 [Mycena sanguinolenta]